MTTRLRVLVACEYSGAVRDAFIDATSARRLSMRDSQSHPRSHASASMSARRIASIVPGGQLSPAPIRSATSSASAEAGITTTPRAL